MLAAGHMTVLTNHTTFMQPKHQAMHFIELIIKSICPIVDMERSPFMITSNNACTILILQRLTNGPCVI